MINTYRENNGCKGYGIPAIRSSSGLHLLDAERERHVVVCHYCGRAAIGYAYTSTGFNTFLLLSGWTKYSGLIGRWACPACGASTPKSDPAVAVFHKAS